MELIQPYGIFYESSSLRASIRQVVRSSIRGKGVPCYDLTHMKNRENKGKSALNLFEILVGENGKGRKNEENILTQIDRIYINGVWNELIF